MGGSAAWLRPLAGSGSEVKQLSQTSARMDAAVASGTPFHLLHLIVVPKLMFVSLLKMHALALLPKILHT